MIDYSNFNETLPSFKPLLDITTWVPLMVIAPLVVMFVLSSRDIIGKAAELEDDPDNPDESYGNRLLRAFTTDFLSFRNFMVRGVTTLAIVGVIAGWAISIPLPSDHQAAASETFIGIEEEVEDKYAIAGLTPIGNRAQTAVSDTVEELKTGAATPVEVQLPNDTSAIYYLQTTDEDVTLTNPAGHAGQTDPELLLNENVLDRRDELLANLQESYQIEDIAPAGVSGRDNTAAWFNILGEPTEDTAPNIRVTFSDGQQANLTAVVEDGTYTLVGTATVNPDDYTTE